MKKQKPKVFRTVWMVIVSWSVWFPACQRPDSQHNRGDFKSTVILISMDGFRWDYLDWTDTPNLDYLADNGVRAEALIPAFPSKTFPNHYTIVTGLYPENHGIVSNRMYDPQFDAFFFIGEDSEPARDGRWYEGEPLWVTAEKQGQTTATMFWPGSDAEIGAFRPTHWHYYDGSVSNAARVDTVLSWLDLAENGRPTFITLYFSDTDSWGHRYGPRISALDTVIQSLDATVGMLMDGLKQREILNDVNLIVTSDHGMTQLSPDRVIFLDDYIDLEDVTVADWSPVAALWPMEGKENSVYQTLQGAHPNLWVYHKEDIPGRFHYRNHRRISPIICLADEGWSITSRDYFDAHPSAYTGGAHGYDNGLATMRGIFIADGPAFKDSLVVEPFRNIHIYELACHILDLQPATNDGSLDSVIVFLEQ